MDPQLPPATQPNPTPIPMPTLPSAPSSPQSMPPVNQPPVFASPTPIPPLKNGKGKLGLILGIVGGVIIIVLVLFFLLVFLPNVQATSVSNKFMNDITTGNASAAAALTDGGSSNDAFLQQASKSVSGSYSLHSTKMEAGQGYYLYTLTNSTNKYARTIIKKESGGWKITSFVFSDTPLALVPSESSDSSMSTSNSTQSASASSDTSGCLTTSDFSFFSNLDMGSPTQMPNGLYEDFFQLQFNPNDATYADGDIPDPTTVYSDFKSFYAQDANKKYSIELESSVNSASPDETLANARNSKVQSDLETISGIPASKIVIQPITNDTSGDSASDAFYRQVQITLVSADSCVTS